MHPDTGVGQTVGEPFGERDHPRLGRRVRRPPAGQQPRHAGDSLNDEISPFHALGEAFRTMAKATIAVIEGVAGGGGSELAVAFDMRFAALGKTQLAQPEVALSIIPGGGGTQRLRR